ncbi:VanZ family protein [Nocardioides cavernae]|uniref:VanZ family protein n=1 Tax=Nocardioides cavernae TaxID=1921566 RepID=A0ABR8N5K7_9ACTN|nr:VanZ family protein [Nocardioides cavernae]MBD3923435.1 VanZ family protein [Nocardioides cavernae]MBM7511642.1 VanZ family protein [Nocardioides cavernae]
MSVRPLSRRARTALGAALVAWVVLLSVVLLAPSSSGPDWVILHLTEVLQRLGLPEVLTSFGRVESMLNVVAFVPLSLLGSLLWTRPTWRDWTAVGFVVSFAVEVVQAVALDARQATNADVVANTLGMLVGALLGLLVLRLLDRRDRGASEGGADLADRQSPAEELEPPR